MNILKEIKEHIVSCLLIVFVVLWCVGFIYCVCNGMGFYCEYCHKGGQNIDVALSCYGRYPCFASKDSCHYFRFYFVNPEGRYAGYKYVKNK